MSGLDLVIAGGTVVTAADSYAADIGIRDGRIAQIGQGLTGAERIDATGLLVLPGGIDALTNESWSALHPEHRVALYVRYTDVRTGEYEDRILNQYAGEDHRA